MSSPEKDAAAILEAQQHPERFCQICGKRNGVCKHTRNNKERKELGKNMQNHFNKSVLRGIQANPPHKKNEE